MRVWYVLVVLHFSPFEIRKSARSPVSEKRSTHDSKHARDSLLPVPRARDSSRQQPRLDPVPSPFFLSHSTTEEGSRPADMETVSDRDGAVSTGGDGGRMSLGMPNCQWRSCSPCASSSLGPRRFPHLARLLQQDGMVQDTRVSSQNNFGRDGPGCSPLFT